MGLLTNLRGLPWSINKEASANNVSKPNGVPSSYGWYNMGRIGNALSSPNYDTTDPWGQIYKASGATISSDVLVKVGYLEGWTLSLATGLWTQLFNQTRVVGGMYTEDFVGATVPATFLSNSPAPVIVEMQAGRCFHFFPSNRILVDVADTIGFITCFQAKLISKTGASIEAEVGTIIGSTGADAWADNSITTGNTDLFIGGFKPLTTSWRKFYGINMRWPALKKYGVPASLAQLTQTDPQALDPDYVP